MRSVLKSVLEFKSVGKTDKTHNRLRHVKPAPEEVLHGFSRRLSVMVYTSYLHYDSVCDYLKGEYFDY